MKEAERKKALTSSAASHERGM